MEGAISLVVRFCQQFLQLTASLVGYPLNQEVVG